MTGLEASPGPFVGGLFHTDKEQMLRHNLKVTREKELEVETRKRITPEEKVHGVGPEQCNCLQLNRIKEYVLFDVEALCSPVYCTVYEFLMC